MSNKSTWGRESELLRQNLIITRESTVQKSCVTHRKERNSANRSIGVENNQSINTSANVSLESADRISFSEISNVSLQ